MKKAGQLVLGGPTTGPIGDTVRSLSEIFSQAVAAGAVLNTVSLNELGDSEFSFRKRPRPSGCGPDCLAFRGSMYPCFA